MRATGDYTKTGNVKKEVDCSVKDKTATMKPSQPGFFDAPLFQYNLDVTEVIFEVLRRLLVCLHPKLYVI